MARIRTIKPAFFRHEGLYEAEKETGLPLRVSFAGLWTAADKSGRFKWLPRELKLDCLPYDEVDFSRVLDALATRGHIVKYASEGKFYGVIPSWDDHQIINNRETDSVLPDPEKCSIESIDCTCEARVEHASGTPLKQLQGEGKGREGKGNVASSIQAAKEILTYLNEKSGRAYRPVDANLNMIIARLKEGATSEDCISVIDFKVKQWGSDQKMDRFLRPETLFNATKFAQYIGEVSGKSNEIPIWDQ